MKFANIRIHRNGLNNLGDNMQLIAIENVYKNMGIKYDDVVRIDFYDLKSYSGEYVILPISFPFYGYKDDMTITMFSDRIIPVFLGLSLMDAELNNAEIMYLKRFEPIGCRDEHTMNLLRRKGIDSYLNGCLTSTLPLQEELRNNLKQKGQINKIFCVDVEEKYRRYLPDYIRNNAEFISQMVFDVNDSEYEAKRYYDRYIREAKLVVTTRLHCALPCLAAGIPVVLFKDKYSFRFPWLNKLMPIYTEEQMSSVNWSPEPTHYEDLKNEILENAKRQITKRYNDYNQILGISFYFETRNTNYIVEHFSKGKEYIDHNWSKDQIIRYSFWGITQPMTMLYRYISENYPNAQLMYIYDKTKRVNLFGKLSKDPSEIKNDEDTFVFVTTASAFFDAEKMFSDLNKKNFFQCNDDGVLR